MGDFHPGSAGLIGGLFPPSRGSMVPPAPAVPPSLSQYSQGPSSVMNPIPAPQVMSPLQPPSANVVGPPHTQTYTPGSIPELKDTPPPNITPPSPPPPGIAPVGSPPETPMVGAPNLSMNPAEVPVAPNIAPPTRNPLGRPGASTPMQAPFRNPQRQAHVQSAVNNDPTAGATPQMDTDLPVPGVLGNAPPPPTPKPGNPFAASGPPPAPTRNPLDRAARAPVSQPMRLGPAASGGDGGYGALASAIQRAEGWKPGTRSYRNNNPGNLEYGQFARSLGATGSDGRFAIFPDEATGQNALVQLLKTKYAGMSIAEIGAKWAPVHPSLSNKENALNKNWPRNVAKWSGLSLDYVPGSNATQTAHNAGVDSAGKQASTSKPMSIMDYAQQELGTPGGNTEGLTESVVQAYELLNAASVKAGYGPLNIISGYRSKAQNARVGGASRSQHMAGAAMDFAGAKNWSPEKRAFVIKTAKELGAKGLGDYSSGALHVDWRPTQTAAWWGGGPTEAMWRK